MKQIKVHRIPERPQKAPFGEPLASTRQERVHLLDTCYLRRLAFSGYSVYDSLKRLKELTGAELVITLQVLEELSGQLKSYTRHVSREEAKRPISEIHRAIGEGILQLEVFQVSREELARFSSLMKSASEKKNSRVGVGEASLFMVAKKFREALSRVSIISEDGDVATIKTALGWEDVSVAVEPAA